MVYAALVLCQHYRVENVLHSSTVSTTFVVGKKKEVEVMNDIHSSQG